MPVRSVPRRFCLVLVAAVCTPPAWLAIGAAAEPTPLFSDPLEEDGWSLTGRGFRSASFGGLAAQSGPTFFALRNPNAYTVCALERSEELELTEGVWELTVLVGQPKAKEPFVGLDRIAFGLLDPASEAPAGTDEARALRERISGFAGGEGVTQEVVSREAPAAGQWSPYTVRYNVAAGAALLGKPVRIGLFAVTGADGGAVAFDAVEVRHEPPAAEPQSVFDSP